MIDAGRFAQLIAAVLAVALLSGCGSTGPAPVDSRDGFGPVPEGYYRIHSGDTLYAIAFRNGLDVKTLARWNRIESPFRIYSGRLLRVEPPDGNSTAKRPESVKSSKQGRSTTAKTTAKAVPTGVSSGSKSAGVKASSSGLNWRWPLDGRVTQTFRGGDRTRQGIRIAGKSGQNVLSSEAGTVVYSGSGLKGYGNLIIIKHNNDYLSAYGFNRRLLVKEGERVKRGQGVAEVGQMSGGDYLLHFEIRRDGKAVNPIDYLPRSR